jgi:glycosyltransferase 2 family protein
VAYVVWRNWSAPGETGFGLAEAVRQPLQLLPLVLAGLLCLVSVLLTSVRWYVLVRAQELPFTLAGAVRLGLFGYFLSTFLPGSIGGDVVKAAFLAREQTRRTAAVATVILDRIIGLCGLFWLVALSGGLVWAVGHPALSGRERLQPLVLGAVAVVGATVLAWPVMGLVPDCRARRLANGLHSIPKIGGPLAEFWCAVWMYRHRGASLALALGLSLMVQTGYVLAFYFTATALRAHGQAAAAPAAAEHFLVIPVGLLIQAFFPTPGGVGGGEYGFGKLYALLGRPEATGILASLLQRSISWVIGLLGCVVYWCGRTGPERRLLVRPATVNGRRAGERTLGLRSLRPPAGPSRALPGPDNSPADRL